MVGLGAGSRADVALAGPELAARESGNRGGRGDGCGTEHGQAERPSPRSLYADPQPEHHSDRGHPLQRRPHRPATRGPRGRDPRSASCEGGSESWAGRMWRCGRLWAGNGSTAAVAAGRVEQAQRLCRLPLASLPANRARAIAASSVGGQLPRPSTRVRSSSTVRSAVGRASRRSSGIG